MCIFSGVVEQVSATRIFGRRHGSRQLLAYELSLAARRDVAMVLPLPVASGGEVQWIDLSGYPDLFDDLDACFPRPRSLGFDTMGLVAAGGMLEVHQVGDFEASFVPTRADFDRLDPRFRLDDRVWRALPGVDGFGFAVFKLRGSGRGKRVGGRAPTRRIHPMAFSFPSAEDRVFFPTVHVHDGQVHRAAHFDHVLYAQAEEPAEGWATAETRRPLDLTRTRGLVRRGQLHRVRLRGDLENRDVRFGLSLPGVG